MAYGHFFTKRHCARSAGYTGVMWIYLLKNDHDLSVQKIADSNTETAKEVYRNLRISLAVAGPLILLIGVTGVLGLNQSLNTLSGAVVSALGVLLCLFGFAYKR